MPITQDRLHALALAGRDYQSAYTTLHRHLSELILSPELSPALTSQLSLILASYIPSPDSAFRISYELDHYARKSAENRRKALDMAQRRSRTGGLGQSVSKDTSPQTVPTISARFPAPPNWHLATSAEPTLPEFAFPEPDTSDFSLDLAPPSETIHAASISPEPEPMPMLGHPSSSPAGVSITNFDHSPPDDQKD